MNEKNVTYESNPEEFERILRQNLSSNNHTKEALINFGVQMAIEAEKTEIEFKKYRDIAIKGIQSEGMASRLMSNFKSWDLTQIANVLESNFGFTDIANLLRKSKAITNKSMAVNGGKARAAKNPKTQALKQIKEVEYPIKKHLFHLRGRRTEFVNEMHAKYPIITNIDSIKQLVDRLNKQNGITQKSQSKLIATQPAQ